MRQSFGAYRVMHVVPSVANALGYIGRVRVALFVALLAFAVLALPDQTLELYIVYAQALIGVDAARATGRSAFASADFPLVQQFALGILGTVLLSTVMWICTLRLLLVSRAPESEPPLHPHLRHELIATHVSLLPVLALILGFQSAVTALPDSRGLVSSVGFLKGLPDFGVRLQLVGHRERVEVGRQRPCGNGLLQGFPHKLRDGFSQHTGCAT